MANPEGASRFAEFQDLGPEHISSSAPEKILFADSTKSTVTESTRESGSSKHVSEKGEVLPEVLEQPSEENRRKPRTLCGLSLRSVSIIVVIIILALLGIILGVVFGTKHNSTKVEAAASTAPVATLPSSSTSTASSEASTPTLAIIEASYAGQMVTEQARTALQKGPNIFINLTDTNLPLGPPDPWFGVKKCLSILHSYGSSIRTFVACNSDGNFELVPGNVSLSPNTQEITRLGPVVAGFAIVSAVWGAQEIRNSTIYARLVKCKQDNTPMTFSTSLFGNDTFFGTHKSGVVWYTEDNYSTIKSITTREGNTVSFF